MICESILTNHYQMTCSKVECHNPSKYNDVTTTSMLFIITATINITAATSVSGISFVTCILQGQYVYVLMKNYPVQALIPILVLLHCK